MKNCRALPFGLLIAILAGCGGQRLEPWHTADLTNEFVAGMADEVRTFDDYLALEDRLFDELQTKIYAEVGTSRNMQSSDTAVAAPRIRQHINQTGTAVLNFPPSSRAAVFCCSMD